MSSPNQTGRRDHGLVGQRGATLVEVLVAVTLLSGALYALVAAQVVAWGYTQMSRHRVTAVLLAADMGERMRANLGRVSQVQVEGEGGGAALVVQEALGFHGGDYDYARDFQSQQGAVHGPAESCAAATSRCTAAQIAALDLAQWRQTVRRQLPEGAVYTQRDAARAVMDLWVAWRESAREAPAPSASFTASDEAPMPVGECPDGLGRGDDRGLRCVHLRIGL